MLSDAQLFGNNFTATRTQLRRVLGVNQYHTPPGFCRLVRGELHELTPGHICNALVDDLIPVGLHTTDIQILKGDKLVLVDQFSAFLVREILPPVRLALVGVLQGVNRFSPRWTAFGQLLFFPLQTSNIFRVPLHPALARNLPTVRKDGEGSQAKIHPYHLIGWGQRLFVYLAGKAGVPVANRIPANSESLACAFQWPVKDNLDLSNLREGQPFTLERKTRLFESEAIIAPIPLEARIPGSLTSFYPAEEGLKGQIDSLLRVLQNLRMHLEEFWLFCFPACQQFIGVIQRERLFLLRPGAFADCQGFVIDPTARLQRSGKPGSLMMGWAKSKLEGFLHRTIVLRSYMSCNLRKKTAKAGKAFHLFPLKRGSFHGLKPKRGKIGLFYG